MNFIVADRPSPDATELTWPSELNAKPKELEDYIASFLMKAPGMVYYAKVPYLRTDLQRALLGIGFTVSATNYNHVTLTIDTKGGYP